MSMTDFERMLAAVLPARGKTSLTLTDVPRGDDRARRGLSGQAGRRAVLQGRPLTRRGLLVAER